MEKRLQRNKCKVFFKNRISKMSKTRIVVKDDQILVDVEWLFNEIRDAKGDWRKIEKMMKTLLESVQNEN